MKAVGYCRVSTSEQAEEGISLDAQREKIRAYCVLKNLELIKLRFKQDKPFADIAKSVGKTESAIYKAISTIRLSLANCVKRTLQTAGKESLNG